MVQRLFSFVHVHFRLSSRQTHPGGKRSTNFVEVMAFYSGCSLVVAIPQDYSKKDDLTQFLASKLNGCEISAVEDPTIEEPFAERVRIREDSKRGSLQGTRDFASPANPAPMESTSGEFLMGTAGEAIREFLRDSKDSEFQAIASQRYWNTGSIGS
jgi:hypothetical protein